MTDDQSDAIGDVINLLAAPIASGMRSIEQFRRGTDEFWRAIENLNATLENLNLAATRINALLEEVEEPVKAMMPQLTRTIQNADEITRRLEGPVRAAAPNIEQAVETFSNPAFRTLPNQLGDFMQVMGEVSKRLGPLAQFAENAGGLFGGIRLPGMGGTAPATKRPAAAGSSPEPAPAKESASKKPAPKKSAARKSSTAKKKKPAAKKKSKASDSSDD